MAKIWKEALFFRLLKKCEEEASVLTALLKSQKPRLTQSGQDVMGVRCVLEM